MAIGAADGIVNEMMKIAGWSRGGKNGPGNPQIDPQIDGVQAVFAAIDVHYSAPAVVPVVILILMAVIVRLPRGGDRRNPNGFFMRKNLK